MNAFTPGPWRFEAVERWPFGVRVVAADGGTILSQDATCHSTEQNTRADNEAGVGFSGQRRHANFTNREEARAAIAEQDANARLIAAAPDLLEALKAARRELWALYSIEGYAKTHLDEHLHNIDAAIAKAEGRES